MKETLQSGIHDKHTFVVPASKTVPVLYPESDEFIAGLDKKRRLATGQQEK